MEFAYSDKVAALQDKLRGFMDHHVYPNEARHAREIETGDRWQPTALMEELKAKAKLEGLWNLFLPHSPRGAGLSNLEYAPLCEIMGRSPMASEAFNCSAPDTGNMETLELYGNEDQKKQWLKPLLDGEIRSCFAMTEPAVASSDATNIESTILRDGEHYVINGRKWWTTGAPDPRCKIIIFMGKTDPANPDRYRQQSMVLVPIDTPGVKVLRPLSVFGYDDAPHGHAEVLFENVRVPRSNILLGEGRGFEIAQGRLGPGRIHHCMRAIGASERAIELMCKRAVKRQAFGGALADKQFVQDFVAKSRIEVDQARLLTLNAAWQMDTVGKREARQTISMIKVVAANVVMDVIDRAMQVHGALGVSDDTPLAMLWRNLRMLRLADGPDEVHKMVIALREINRWREDDSPDYWGEAARNGAIEAWTREAASA
jgi:acyl-CoA dehydrogenase